MYTIFKNDTSIILTDEIKYKNSSNFYYWDRIVFVDWIGKIAKNELNEVILYHSDLKFIWKEFLNYFKVIEAAGGVVKNSENSILFIYRNEKWDLPKGKIEENESIQEAALREVKEECGIENVEIKDFIIKTYHIYPEKGKDILKISHWFNMISNERTTSPQIEEDITKVVWKNKFEIELAMKNTYPNIKLLVNGLD